MPDRKSVPAYSKYTVYEVRSSITVPIMEITQVFNAFLAHFDPKGAGDMSTLFDVGGILGKFICVHVCSLLMLYALFGIV